MGIFSIILGLYVFFSGMVAVWFWRYLKRHAWLAWGVSLLIVLLTALYPVYFVCGGSSRLDVFLIKLGATWAGVFFYAFLLGVLIDVYFIFFPEKKERSAYRHFACLTVVFLTMCIAFLGCRIASNPILKEGVVEIKCSDFDFSAKAAGRVVKVAVLTDVHLGRLVNVGQFKKMIDQIKRHNPDLVLFAGDILDDHVFVDVSGIKAILSEVNAQYGIWGCPGNHEYHSGSIQESLNLLEKMGIRMLVDQYTVIDRSFVLIGREDRFGRLKGRLRKGIPDIIGSLPEEDKNLPLIIMDHQPVELGEAEVAGAAMQVSGHTHNGQIWPGNFLVRRLYENPYGWLRRGNTHFLVSAGSGTWGPPIRTSSRPEVHLIRLCFVE